MTRRTPAANRRTPSALGTSEQLPSGRWRASYRRDGRKFTAPATFDTKADADAWLAMEHADRARGLWRDPAAGRVTLEDYARDWLATRVDLQPKTHDHYTHTLNRWIVPRIGTATGRGVQLGAMDVADITPATVRAWYAAVFTAVREGIRAQHARTAVAKGDPARAWALSRGMDVKTTGVLSPAIKAAWRTAGSPVPTSPRPLPHDAGEAATANAYRVLRTIMSAAVTDGLIPTSPCQVKGAGQVSRKERPVASREELDALAAHMPERLAAAVILAGWSAMRRGELFALTRRHIDMSTGTVRVERSMVERAGHPVAYGPPKTRSSLRTTVLPRFVVAILAEHLERFVPTDPDALLFTLENGNHVSTQRQSRIFAKARAAIGRDDLHWHDLRHTAATFAYSAGAAVPDVQGMLGHSTIRAAEIYAHTGVNAATTLAQRLDAMYAPA